MSMSFFSTKIEGQRRRVMAACEWVKYMHAVDFTAHLTIQRARLLPSEKYYSTFFIPIALYSPISLVGIGTDQRLALQDEEDGRWQGEWLLASLRW
jgi:hypothetical protein